QSGIAGTEPQPRGCREIGCVPPLQLGAANEIDERQDSLLAVEPDDLREQREKGREINESEHAQERPRRARMTGAAQGAAPYDAGHVRAERTVRGDPSVCRAREGREAGQAAIEREPYAARGAEDGFGALVPVAIGFEELHRFLEMLDGPLRIARRHVLIFRIVDAVTGARAPALDPQATEVALAVVDEKRLGQLSHGGREPRFRWPRPVRREWCPA